MLCRDLLVRKLYYCLLKMVFLIESALDKIQKMKIIYSKIKELIQILLFSIVLIYNK